MVKTYLLNMLFGSFQILDIDLILRIVYFSGIAACLITLGCFKKFKFGLRQMLDRVAQ